MSSTFSDEHPPRRNARSFDLDYSATKAAAWVWHLHESTPGVTTEGRFLSSQSRRRSSGGSSDSKISRFRREAAGSATMKEGRMSPQTPMWDCGSNLYDTFELVALGNRLDRSLMVQVLPSSPHPAAPLQAHATQHMSLPLHEPKGLLRAWSLPKSEPAPRKRASKKMHANGAAPTDVSRVSLAKTRELSFSVFDQGRQGPKGWGKVMKVFKKMVDLHKQASMNAGCKQSIQVVEHRRQRPLEPPIGKDGDNEQLANPKGRIKARRYSMDEDLLLNYGRSTKGSTNHHVDEDEASKPRISSQILHKHLHQHHHHHHHHHHYLPHNLASESARLSPETLSQIWSQNGW